MYYVLTIYILFFLLREFEIEEREADGKGPV